MNLETLAPYLGLWGAGLSTLLAGLKFVELWKSRIRVAVSYTFTGSEEIGSKIILTNLTPRQISVTYWRLVWVKKNWFRSTIEEEFSPEPLDETHFTIAAHDQKVLSFIEGENLTWGRNAISLGKLRIDLSIAGRTKPLRLTFYDPTK